MATHPNRSKNRSSKSTPTVDEIKRARESAGLTQKAAAELIYCTERGWQDWEYGKRRMHPAFFEVFLEKTLGMGICGVVTEHIKRLRELGIETEISWTRAQPAQPDQHGLVLSVYVGPERSRLAE